MIGIDKAENREIWVSTGKTKAGDKDLEPEFVENIKVIHNICEQLGDRVSLLSNFSIRPREYEGRRYGSERLQKILAKTWEAMDRIAPVQRAGAPESFSVEEQHIYIGIDGFIAVYLFFIFNAVALEMYSGGVL